MKHYIALLSNNNVSNDQQAFMTLFKTFMADLDSREDCHIALHLLKDAEEHVVGRYDAVVRPQEANEGGTLELPQSLEGTCLTDEKAESQGVDDDDADGLYVRALANYLDECVNCRRELENIHFWYFWCLCLYTALCRRCYH